MLTKINHMFTTLHKMSVDIYTCYTNYMIISGDQKYQPYICGKGAFVRGFAFCSVCLSGDVESQQLRI